VRRLLALVLVCAAAGCVRVGRLALVEPAGAAGRSPAAAPGARARGDDCVHVAAVVPVTRLPSVERAAARALAGGGRALADVEVRYELLLLPLYARGCYVVEGAPR
jgi:hypothetical protein